VEGEDMRSEFNKQDRETLEKVIKVNFGGIPYVDPAILSCGGIYIPHKNDAQKLIYHIITTSNQKSPVRVISGVNPQNILLNVMLKESMN